MIRNSEIVGEEHGSRSTEEKNSTNGRNGYVN